MILSDSNGGPWVYDAPHLSRGQGVPLPHRLTDCEACVLAALRAHGPQTEPEIVARSGYSQRAVNNALWSMYSDAVVTDSRRSTGGKGRPARVWMVRA